MVYFGFTPPILLTGFLSDVSTDSFLATGFTSFYCSAGLAFFAVFGSTFFASSGLTFGGIFFSSTDFFSTCLGAVVALSAAVFFGSAFVSSLVDFFGSAFDSSFAETVRSTNSYPLAANLRGFGTLIFYFRASASGITASMLAYFLRACKLTSIGSLLSGSFSSVFLAGSFTVGLGF